MTPFQFSYYSFLCMISMIDRESRFSKLRMSVPQICDEEIEEIGFDGHNFLEVCSVDDAATGSGILEESNKDDSMHLRSIWISVAKLAVPVMEGEF